MRVTNRTVACPQDDDVIDILRALIREHVDLSGRRIELSTTLAEIGFDSLAVAETMVALEARLGLSIDEPAALPGTVGDVVDFALAACRLHGGSKPG